jgi:formylglycine-generating enzyme required for sulfatase activity
MIRITDFCMDIYEASHEDATSSSYGTSPVAASQPDVLPWFPLSADVTTALSTARAACANAGKRLCQLDEWISACEGPSGWAYGYGNTYDPLICNGLDTYCYCSSAACSSLLECPYAACYNQPSPEGGGPCGAAFHVMPTASFDQCLDYWGVYDINGNVWELVDTTDGLAHYRGGAYNCNPSPALHRCDHDGTWTPAARGFRCCKDNP